MWTTNIVWLALLAALPGADQPGRLMSASGMMGDVVIRFTTMAEPPLPTQKGTGGGIVVRKDRIQRYVADPTSNQWFGYDLVAVPEGPNRFRVSFEPLSLRPDEIQGFKTAPTVVLQPKLPAPQVLENGDTIAVDLLVTPDGRGKIVEYIQVSSKEEPPPARTAAEARDFTLDDGPLEFSFEQPAKLLVNGQSTNDLRMTSRPGGTLWFNIPGRGRYILSLTPHEGFEKAGAIRDNAIIFQDGGERYELRTSGPILGAGRAWNLYMLRDPSYPAGDTPHYGTDRLDNLLPKR